MFKYQNNFKCIFNKNKCVIKKNKNIMCSFMICEMDSNVLNPDTQIFGIILQHNKNIFFS